MPNNYMPVGTFNPARPKPVITPKSGQSMAISAAGPQGAATSPNYISSSATKPTQTIGYTPNGYVPNNGGTPQGGGLPAEPQGNPFSGGLPSMPSGPSITPQTVNAAGEGGQQNPAYLQMRTAANNGPAISPRQAVDEAPDTSGKKQNTEPVIPGGATGPGDTVAQGNNQGQGDVEVKQQKNPAGENSTGNKETDDANARKEAEVNVEKEKQKEGDVSNTMGNGQKPYDPGLPSGGQPPISPPPNGPAQAGGNTLGDLYKFFASDLANQTKQAKSNAIADASSRGVYYGTPLTGSEADIDTQYLRGMGQLQAGMYGNEQSNQLARLGLATNLSWQGQQNAPPTGQPIDWSGLGALFGNGNTTSPFNTTRTGPSNPPITPNNNSGKNNPANQPSSF